MAGESPSCIEMKRPNANVRQSIITIVVVLGFMVSTFLFISKYHLSWSRSHMGTLRTSLKSHEKGSAFTFQCVPKVPSVSLVIGSRMTQVEHIDNPKGYGDGKDPRDVDPGLRPVCIAIVFTTSEPLTASCSSPY